MLKKTITYIDFNGVEQHEDFYFNLSKVEMTELQVSRKGGFSEWARQITAANDEKEMLQVFKDFILNSVGVKSDDGKRFVKSEEIRKDFMSSPAFDSLFMEIASDSNSAMAFMRGIMPADLVVEFDAEMVKQISDSVAVSPTLAAENVG